MGRREKVLKVRCPICRKDVLWEGNPYSPFCSERCQLIDLGEWISEEYRISTPIEDSESELPIREEGSD